MYTQVWNKYLPVIKILMKKSIAHDQLLDMNSTDFERAGGGRKTGCKFSILFSNGRAGDLDRSSTMAKDLVEALLEDDATKDLIIRNDYQMDLNAKFQLGIRHIPKQPLPDAAMEKTD